MTTAAIHDRVVIVCETISPLAAAWLAQHADVVDSSPAELADEPALGDARGLVVRTHTVVDALLLDEAPHLRVVGRAGVGLDNIDLDTCRARGIRVVHTPNANTQAVAEYVLLLLLDATRPLVSVSSDATMDDWERLRRSATAPRQLSEMRLGVLGLGRIGRRVAEITSTLGMQVIYNDLEDVEEPAGVRSVAVNELFAESDVVSIHVDGRPENRGFVGPDLIEAMSPEVIFLNTSRGFVVNTPALASFLQRHPEAEARLDVHEPEPITSGHPLLSVPNAQLYPHLASRTTAAVEAMSWVVRDVVSVLDGEAPRHAAV